MMAKLKTLLVLVLPVFPNTSLQDKGGLCRGSSTFLLTLHFTYQHKSPISIIWQHSQELGDLHNKITLKIMSLLTLGKMTVMESNQEGRKTKKESEGGLGVGLQFYW